MNSLSAVMFAVNLVTITCVLMATVSATVEEDMLDLRQSDVGHDVLKRATPPADYRYSNDYYNAVSDYHNNNALGYKPGYNTPASYNPGYYNPAYYNTNRYNNRRSYPNYYEGSPYGPYNSGYYSGYYNNTRYPYGNYQGYRANYPNPYQNYPGYQGYNPYNPAYNDRYYDQGYYQSGLYNNAGAYSRSDDAGLNRKQ